MKNQRTLPGRGLCRARLLFAILIVAAASAAACVQANPPTDVGNPVAPSAPANDQPAPPPSPQPSPTSSAQSLAYVPDMKPIFDSDCVVCHGGSRPSANYSMSSYAGVMRDVSPGNPNSRLVIWTQRGGTMYRFWTGNASQKAAMVSQWVVNNNAAQSR